ILRSRLESGEVRTHPPMIDPVAVARDPHPAACAVLKKRCHPNETPPVVVEEALRHLLEARKIGTDEERVAPITLHRDADGRYRKPRRHRGWPDGDRVFADAMPMQAEPRSTCPGRSEFTLIDYPTAPEWERAQCRVGRALALDVCVRIRRVAS